MGAHQKSYMPYRLISYETDLGDFQLINRVDLLLTLNEKWDAAISRTPLKGSIRSQVRSGSSSASVPSD